MKPLIPIAIIAMLVGVAPGVSAQTGAIRLTLNEAITRGFEHNDRLDEMAARVEAARAVADQRDAASGPQVALQASYTRINHIDEFALPGTPGTALRVIFPDIPNNYRSRIDLQWPIYTAGRLQGLTRAATAEAEAAGQDRTAAQGDLKLEITRSFWAVITARASSEVVRQALERTNAHLTDVRNQLSVGLIPPSDVLSVEAQQAHQRMLRIEADNIVETTSAEFRRLTGLEPDTPIELVSDFANVAPAQPAPAAVAAVDLAKANRPERKAIQFRLDAAAERVTAASAGSLPQLSALGGVDYARPNQRHVPIQDLWKPSWDIGISMRWSVFDGHRSRAEEAEAVAARRAAEARLRDFDGLVQVEVRQRLADLNSARATIDAAQAGVRSAAEARRVLAERFSAGVATNTDVLNAQVALLQAELDLTRAFASVALATARLDRAMGR